MTVTQAIENRRSIRKYLDKEVDKSIIEKMIKAAALAPSAKNRQPWKFIVCTGKSKEILTQAMDKGIKREIMGDMRISEFRFGLSDARNTASIMKKAPVLIVILNTQDSSPFDRQDNSGRITEICNTLSIGAAVENMILKAQEEGIGTLWIANTCFAYEEIKSYLHTEYQITGILAAGLSAEQPLPRPRKSFEETAEFWD